MRWRALVPLLAGLVLMLAAQLGTPLSGPPLYDGVIVQEPYRYLAPGPGQAGSPSSFAASETVDGAASPQFVAATTESPPQAQLIALTGAFVIPAGAAALDVSIAPLAAPAPPSSGPIVGNVYRFAVADPSGSPAPISPATPPTVVLRAPNGVVDATIARYGDATWQDLPTQPSGQPGVFLANVDALGDFALILGSSAGLFGLDPRLVAIGVATAVAAALLVLAVVWLDRRRRIPDGASTVPPRRPAQRRRGGRRRRGSR